MVSDRAFIFHMYCYKSQCHLSRSYIRVIFFKKWQLLGHSCLKNTSCFGYRWVCVVHIYVIVFVNSSDSSKFKFRCELFQNCFMKSWKYLPKTKKYVMKIQKNPRYCFMESLKYLPRTKNCFMKIKKNTRYIYFFKGLTLFLSFLWLFFASKQNFSGICWEKAKVLVSSIVFSFTMFATNLNTDPPRFAIFCHL